MVHLSQLISSYWYIFINYSLYLIWVPLVVTWCPCLLPNPIRLSHYIQAFFLLLLVWPWSFLRHFLFLMSLTEVRGRYFEDCGQVSGRLFLNCSLSPVFHHEPGAIGGGEGRSEVTFSSHHVKGTCCQGDLLLLMSPWITWLVGCLPAFSVESRFSQSFHIILSGGSFYAQPTVKERKVIVHHLESRKSINCSEFSAWEICLFSTIYFFTDSFVDININA